MRAILTKTEAMLLAAFLALLAAALAGPAIGQSPHYHDFADQRSMFGVLYAMDVLSNLPFALAGLAAMWFLWRAPARSISNMQRAMSLLFAAGLVLVAFGSATYHLDPIDTGLAVDRYCIAVAFAGLLGIAAAGHVSERAGAALGLLALFAGLASVKLWAATGNLLPWSVFQFGGLVMLWWLASLTPGIRALRVNWALVILAYGVAKALEINDYPIYQLTQHVVSGHTLKHLVASLAAWPVISALAHAGEARDNAAHIAFGDEGLEIRWSKA